MSVFSLPDLGEGLWEAELVAWHVAVGEPVKAGQALATVETDKALVEVASPQAGKIAELCSSPGDRVFVGAPLVRFENGDPQEARLDAGTVVGELPGATRSLPPSPARIAPRPPGTRRASPAARALARALGVDLAAVHASGPDGAVTRADVERVAAAGEPGAAADKGYESMRGVRLAMSRRMTAARQTITPATLFDEADVESWDTDQDATTRLVRALVKGCAAEASLNAWLSQDGTRRRLHPSTHVALAVQTQAGLFAPVLRNAEGQSPAELRAEVDRLVARTEARGLAPSELSGATITLSNFGSAGGRFATLVIVPPQVAILGAGRIAPRVIAHEGAPALRRLLPLSLTFDHRAVTGAEALRFLSAVVADLAHAS